MNPQQEKIRKIFSWIFFGITCVVLYISHRRFRFVMDDMWYSTLLYEDTPIHSFGDIIKAQIWHYQNWGGRSMAHGLLQITLLLGERTADIVNLVLTLLLAFIISKLAGRKGIIPIVIAIGMCLGLNANWRMSMFWQAGIANYVYMTVFILFYLYCYLRELAGEGGVSIDNLPKVSRLPGITFWMIPLGIIAGWSNENMGPAAWIVSLLVILLLFRAGKKPALWMVLGNLTCLLGSVLVIIAPGNFVRKEEVATLQYGVIWQLFLRCYAECKGVFLYLFSTMLVLAAVLLLGKFALGLALGTRNILLLVGALLSWGAMILSPHYPDRASFGTMALLITVIVSMGGKVWDQREDMRWPLWTASSFIWLRGMYLCAEYLCTAWGWIR